LVIKEKSHIFAAENQEFKVKNSSMKKIIGTVAAINTEIDNEKI